MSTAGAILSTPLRLRPAQGAFARELCEGLSAKPKRAPCKYFYDNEGSALFERICALPEYYPTRTELGLLARHAGEIASLLGAGAALIEFGAGSLEKVELLLRALTRVAAYVPVDISGDYLGRMTKRLARLHPEIATMPLAADFLEPLDLPPLPHGARRIGFFPGSTIGNLAPAEALSFLRRTAGLLKGGGLLLGVDLVKEPAILHAAYNDALGVTEAFNKNLLHRANRELDADFDSDAFAHYAFYNPGHKRIEMHLMSLRPQRVQVAGRAFAFDEGETIHTENSYKYTVEGVQMLARRAGFEPVRSWCDDERLFSLHWLAC